jgi:hypothetical protein
LKRWFLLPFFAGVGLSLLWIWLGNSADIAGSVVSVDIDQQRANTVLPTPRGATRIQQSFYPQWNGLREIELILARIGEPEATENGRFHIQLLDETGALVAEQDLATRVLTHNQAFRFRFPAQPNSAGRRYILQLSGNAENSVSVWGYDLDVYGQGELIIVGGALELVSLETPANELRFVTRYQLAFSDALSAISSVLYWEGAILLLALVLIPLPGVLLLLAPTGRRWHWDLATWWGVAFALGVAGWSLLWTLMTLIGGRWQGWSLWLFLITGWIVVAVLWLRSGGALRLRLLAQSSEEDRASSRSALHYIIIVTRSPSFARHWQHAVLLALLLTALAVRLLAVRDLIFPPWVDSSRHALITAVMAEQGQIPTHYDPFLSIERAPYHFGFHTLSASLSLMTDWPLNRLLLFFGQLLNGLLPLTVYAAAWLFTRRRGAGLLAAFLVALPFFFPAYYATWGRMTQLAAMFMMPILLAFTWLVVRGGRVWRRAWWLLGILIAGLFLVHFRVFLLYLAFAALVWLISFGRNGRRLAAAAGVALLLTSPRIVQLATMVKPSSMLGNNIPNYNAVPIGYVQVGWERQFIGLAAVGFLFAVVAGLRGRRWTSLPLTLAGWVVLLVLLLAGERLGLPETSLVNLNSMYITLFLPHAIFLAVITSQAWRWLMHSHWLFQLLGRVGAGVALTILLLFGSRQQIAIINPQTVLARWEDLVGLEWVDGNLPDDAKIAVSSWRWLGNTWAGNDGGAWLVPMTGRESTTPPIDHLYNSELFRSVIDFNESALAITDWSTPEAAQWLGEQGVTHIFVGARGGFLDPSSLARNPEMALVYSRDGIFVFALES